MTPRGPFQPLPFYDSVIRIIDWKSQPAEGYLHFSIPATLLLEYFDDLPSHAVYLVAGQIPLLWLLLGIFEHREQNYLA